MSGHIFKKKFNNRYLEARMFSASSESSAKRENLVFKHFVEILFSDSFSLSIFVSLVFPVSAFSIEFKVSTSSTEIKVSASSKKFKASASSTEFKVSVLSKEFKV